TSLIRGCTGGNVKVVQNLRIVVTVRCSDHYCSNFIRLASDRSVTRSHESCQLTGTFLYLYDPAWARLDLRNRRLVPAARHVGRFQLSYRCLFVAHVTPRCLRFLFNSIILPRSRPQGG